MAENFSYLEDLLLKVERLEWDDIAQEVSILSKGQPDANLNIAWRSIQEGFNDGRNPTASQLTALKLALKNYFTEDQQSSPKSNKVLWPVNPILRILYQVVPALRKTSIFKCLENPLLDFYRARIERIFKEHVSQAIYLDWIHEKDLGQAPGREKWPELSKKSALALFKQGFFLKESFCIILQADSGWGKTTFMQKLFYDYAHTYPSANLAFVYAGQFTLAEIKAIPNPTQTILFLDALDEDHEARQNLEACIKRLSGVLKYFQQVVISTRVQLFRDREQEWQYLYGNRRLIPVTLQPIHAPSYLKLHFGEGSSVYQDAAALVERQRELFKRPLFLSWIEYLIDLGDKEPIKYLSQIYAHLAKKWAQREEVKVEAQELQQRTYAQRLLQFSEELAVYIYKNDTLRLNPESIADIAKRYGINHLDSRDRSFLTRNRENDTWAFTHQSFFEYFLARALLSGRLREEDFDFKAYSATTDLYNEMCWLELAQQEPILEGKLVYWNQDKKFSNELVSLQPNWAIRAMIFAKRNELRGIAPFWVDVVKALRGLFPEVKHAVFDDLHLCEEVLASTKTSAVLQSIHAQQFLLEAQFQYLLKLCKQQDWLSQKALHFRLDADQKAAWPSHWSSIESFAYSLSALLKYNPMLRRPWMSLQALSFSGLGLAAIPTALLDLKELRSLDLSHNQIQKDDPLLKKLLRLPELLELRLEGNPIMHNWAGESDLRALREHYLFPPDMIYVEGGNFKMGLNLETHISYEEANHKVTLSDFYIAQCAVTVGEFRRFIRETGYQQYGFSGGGNWELDTEFNIRANDRHPIVWVSWYDAIEYCNWLSYSTGLERVYTIFQGSNKHMKNVYVNWMADGYRLPTEAEWEYAARQKGEVVYFGNGSNVASRNNMNISDKDIIERMAEAVLESQPLEIEFGGTVPVDSFLPNSLGLYNMSGNVSEWCWDWYSNDYYSESMVYIYNPTGPDIGKFRISRGGYWASAAEGCLVSNRKYHFLPEVMDQYIGFRVCRGAFIR